MLERRPLASAEFAQLWLSRPNRAGINAKGIYPELDLRLGGMASNTFKMRVSISQYRGHVLEPFAGKYSELDPERPQARRAMELAWEKGLTERHIAAIQDRFSYDKLRSLFVRSSSAASMFL